MNLEVLQSSKASSTTLLITLEWSLPGVNSDVRHQLVLSIEWFTLSWTVLQNIFSFEDLQVAPLKFGQLFKHHFSQPSLGVILQSWRVLKTRDKEVFKNVPGYLN